VNKREEKLDPLDTHQTLARHVAAIDIQTWLTYFVAALATALYRVTECWLVRRLFSSALSIIEVI
jgi:hypothetical protein